MARETGYERRIEPSPGAPLPLADATSFGAGAAQAIGAGGEAAHQGQLRAYQIQRSLTADSELTAKSAAFAAHRLNMDGIVQEMRTHPTSPDYTDHVQRVQEANNAGREAILSGITQDSVRNQLSRQFDVYSDNLASTEGTYAAGRAAAKSATDLDNQADLSAARVYHGADPAGELASVIATANSIHNLDPAAREKFVTDTGKKFGLARGEYLNETDPDKTIQLIDSGYFDGMLEQPEQEHLRKGAETAIRTREIEAKSALAAQKTEISATSDVLIKKAKAGEDVPDAQFIDNRHKAELVGLPPAKLYEIDEAWEQSRVNREFKVATPETIQAEILKLENVQKKSSQDVMRLNALRTTLTQRQDEIAHNPMTVAARMGMNVAAVDWTNPDPAAVQTRVSQAYQVSKDTGAAVQILLPPEEAQMKNELATGSRLQREGVMQQLDHISDPFARAAAARQVAPEDKNFQHQAQLAPENRAMVRRGQEAIEANPKFLKPDDKDDTNNIKLTIARVDRDIDLAMKAAGPADVEAAKKTAQEYLAGKLFAGGHTGQDMTETDYRQAVRIALGGGSAVPGAHRIGVSQVGGLGTWQNAGQPFVLPEAVAPGEFGSLVVADRKRQDQAGTGPVDRDGKTPFNLNNAHPVWIAPGLYRWETSAGTVMTKKGEPFLSVIRKPR